MEKINIMVNGLPGNVAKIMAKFGINDDRFNIVPYSLTGQDIVETNCTVNCKDGEVDFKLVKPDTRDNVIKEIKKQFPSFISIDYTHPTAVNANALFYTQNKLAFVMGTTGGDRNALERVVKKASTPAVIAPNMAKQIVGFQAMMEYGAKTFPGLFKGYTLKVTESHQNGKADTSGTARAIVSNFNEMGMEFDVDDIKMVRDPDIQLNEWNIPKEHLTGHGWHTYTMTAPDGSALFEFKHNINGRDIYAAGTFDAVIFLSGKLDSSMDQKLYTMIDVLTSKDSI